MVSGPKKIDFFPPIHGCGGADSFPSWPQSPMPALNSATQAVQRRQELLHIDEVCEAWEFSSHGIPDNKARVPEALHLIT